MESITTPGQEGSREASLAREPSRLAPSLSVPKGGGAIRGIGEKFAANPVTGTGSLSVPILTSPGRSGFGPQLAISYDSSAGSGDFGIGWSLSLPSISRKTDKGLPLYRDAEESDVFILSGSEDLVPVLQDSGGGWEREVPEPRTVAGVAYRIQRYRPRIEGLFAVIERWTSLTDPSDSFWRSISKGNITTWYGRTSESRICDPADFSRVFSWLICESHDDKGNVTTYGYKPEDSAGVDRTSAHERNRTDAGRAANRYLKRIRYGNRSPYSPELRPDAQWPSPPAASDGWLFEVVCDYGEHVPDAPTPGDQGQWPCRVDPFSSYRAGFEVRSYRLCRRILMFHHFPDEPGVGADCLVRSTNFGYSQEQSPDDAGHLIHAVLVAATQWGYSRSQDGGYVARSLPPVEFEYSRAVVRETVQEIDAASLENLPQGLDGTDYQWLDLYGEGVSGIFTAQVDGWFYKPNLSPANPLPESGGESAAVRFGAAHRVGEHPFPAVVESGGRQFLGLAGDGQLDLVEWGGPVPGFFETTEAGRWESFRPFESYPNLNWGNPNLRFVDLTGDGRADVLITEEEAFCWFASLGEAGFASAERVHQALDEEQGPRLVFADGTQSIYLADMSGDGLTDLVRIRNGEVCYWPNLGYGRFGAKVAMDDSPWFDAPDLFDQARVRLADIDGSGLADIVYLHADGVDLYFNQSGNRWSPARRLAAFPAVDDLAAIQVVDLLGNGTACLVWSSPLAGQAERPLRYIDLMGGQKPYLLVRSVNNLGAETVIHYAASTRFYLADKLAGKPWITKLPFPVHVVERVETYDRISGNRFVTRYAYHHGHFDGAEREFRGFGLVEQWDTEEFGALGQTGELSADTNFDAASYVPPVYTRTWFHTGAYLGRDHVSDFFAGLLDDRDTGEYYRAPGLTDADARALLLPDTVLPKGLSFDEEREACRALTGSMLRQETYALDGTAQEPHPYTVAEQNFAIRGVQPMGGNRHAVFFAHPRESLSYHYERDPQDPRVQHALTLEVDDYGNVLKSAAAGYGRHQADPALSPQDQTEQARIFITSAENGYTNAIELDDNYRTPLPSESRSFELTGLALPGGASRFSLDEVLAAGVSAEPLPYEAENSQGRVQKRLIEHIRTLYRPDDLGEAQGDRAALLPLGEIQPLALPGESYQLALTAGLVAQGFAGRVADAMLESEGRYVHSEGDADWWIPSGRAFLSPGGSDDPAAELAYARDHFFLPHRFRDPFHAPGFETESFVSYDGYSLLMQETRDALGNRVTAGERDPDPSRPLQKSGNDYRVLQPALVMDPNRNRTAAAFDALGFVVVTAVMGKPEETLGDTLDGFEAELSDAAILAHLADPLADPQALLGGATTRLVYDLFAYHRTKDQPVAEPPTVYTLARETHEADLASGQATRIQHGFSYSDGFGRETQKKIQAEPGPLTVGGPEASPRWVGSGWTVFNNKGKPVRQYEPFFTDTHRFEFDVRKGVSPILFYDPAGRVVATLNPDHTWQKVVFDAWRQVSWDVNDTALIADPKADPDVGGYFAALAEADYLPTWYAARIGGSLGPEEQAAASGTELHAGTPSVAHADSLGRTFLTVAHNRLPAAESETGSRDLFGATRVVLDIEGNQREVIDALDRVIMRYDYDMLGTVIHSASMDAGERWMLNDAAGQPLRVWDSRGHELRSTYDRLHRPTGQYVRGTDPDQSDPRVFDRELLFQKIEYGEDQPDDLALNLRTRAVRSCDTAGVVLSEAYDFKGNLLRGSRQLAGDYKAVPDWSGSVPLDPQVFANSTAYDALNRPTAATTPDGSVTRPAYNEASLLERIDVNLRGETANGEPVWTAFVTGSGYDAQGQRQSIAYGNGVRTDYAYDPLTFRLVSLTTHRDAAAFPDDCPQIPPADWPGCAVQNLAYTYDPAGNITHIRDDAQQTIYFRNRRVEPSSDYTYDALYQLIEASGREHLGQGTGPTPPDGNDGFHTGLPQPGDGNALGRYVESYVYDLVGNILAMQHRGSDPASPGWTRVYAYGEPSLIEPGEVNNRLSTTRIGEGALERYPCDAHGSMTAMPHLPVMQWTFLDQLQASSRQVVNDGTPEITYYVYDAAGQRVRKVTERMAAVGETPTRMRERIYLGGFELYREYSADGATATLERETLHVMNDRQRIAMVETRTLGDDGTAERLIRYPLSNHLGSACVELDEAGKLISYEEYFPYGSTSYQAVDSGIRAAAKRYRYTGMERDEETGLAYHRARYYAPWSGRWSAADPIGIGDSANVYRYAHNNPMTFVDTRGLAGERRPPRAALPPSVLVEAEPPPIPTYRYIPESQTYRNLRAGSDWYREPVQTFISSGTGSSGGSQARQLSHERVQRGYVETLFGNARLAFGTQGSLPNSQRMQLLEYAEMTQQAQTLGSGAFGRLPPAVRTASLYAARFAEYRAGGGTENFTGWLSQQVQPATGPEGHSLEVVVLRNGLPALAGRVESGVEGSHPIRTWTDQYWTHTEAQFLRENWSLMREGDVVLMVGQREPCPACSATMNHIDAEVGVQFSYRVAGSSGIWESAPLPGSPYAVYNLTNVPPSSAVATEPACYPWMPGIVGALVSLWWHQSDPPSTPLNVVPPQDPNVPTISNPW